MSKSDAKIIHGTVVPFRGLGRKLGFPTANLKVETKLADGVYFGWAKLGKSAKKQALIFIGRPTTVGDYDRRVEAHILDLADKDYYGQELVLEAAHFHRDYLDFKNFDELVGAIKSDEAAAHSWFKHHALHTS